MSGSAVAPDLSLTPDQEGLLRTALASNKPTSSAGILSGEVSSIQEPYYGSNAKAATKNNMYTSPIQNTPGSGQLSGQDESPFLDYNLEDGDFDWDNATGEQLFGDLPGSEYHEENEFHDKRKASMEEEKGDEGSSKRHEGDDKSAKKPGRKPLTGEPTTKRKAQNRAAQRAFRERKERHLKDLETKVEDLEKASETANHENGKLRAQVEKMNMELKEYRKRLSLNNTGLNNSPPQLATRSSYSNSNGNDFSFAFPKFGDLPGSFLNNGSIAKTTSPTTFNERSASTPSNILPAALRKDSSSSLTSKSPISPNGATSTLNLERPYQSPNKTLSADNFNELSALFSPTVLQNASRSNSGDYMTYSSDRSSSFPELVKQRSISSANGQYQNPNGRHGSATSITNSPASSMSHALDSSTGTTPESSADSPDNRGRSETTLNTINEETKTQIDPGDISKSPVSDVNGFNWMAQQNDGQFDPVLFGDYRDPQDNLMNSAFGDFFNDAFPSQDFASPYNTGDVTSPSMKKDLIQEIEVRQDGEPVKEQNGQYVGCDKLWPRIQNSEKVQSGEFDMDQLCGELKAKAKCSGKGAVLDQKEVDRILGPASSKPIDQQDDFLSMFK